MALLMNILTRTMNTLLGLSMQDCNYSPPKYKPSCSGNANQL